MNKNQYIVLLIMGIGVILLILYAIIHAVFNYCLDNHKLSYVKVGKNAYICTDRKLLYTKWINQAGEERWQYVCTTESLPICEALRCYIIVIYTYVKYKLSRNEYTKRQNKEIKRAFREDIKKEEYKGDEE